MRALSRSVLCLLVLGAFALDVAHDADCADGGAGGTTCCACSCGSHPLPPSASALAVTLRPAVYPSFEPPLYAFLSPTPIFHPPRPAA